MTRNISEESWNNFLRYRAFWVTALREFLGWPMERTVDWSSKWEDFATESEGSAGELFHEEPSYYIIPLLISDEFSARIKEAGRSFASQLMSKLQSAIKPREGPSPYDPLYDWSAARRRVQDVLAEYGATLPHVDEKDNTRMP